MPNKRLCAACAQDLERITAHKTVLPQIECVGQCVAAFAYQPPIVGLIQRYKYEGEKYLAQFLAPYMAPAYNEILEAIDCVVPVPIHKQRRFFRGFNQAELLSKYLLQHLQKEELLQANLLLRVKNTPHQVGLERLQRAENVRNAFAVNGAVQGKTILLVDDVLTTGSTMRECAQTLLVSGAKNIYCLTLAYD